MPANQDPVGTSPIGFLTEIVGHLQRRFGAEVLDATDDAMGAIVVDMRIDPVGAHRAYASSLREDAVIVIEHARAATERARALHAQTFTLAEVWQSRVAGLREGLGQFREAASQRRALLGEHRIQLRVAREAPLSFRGGSRG